MLCVLVVAAGAAWEPEALTGLAETPGVVVLKRCVDVNDLLATATTGQADVAVVSVEAPGLDVAALEHLRRHRVRLVAVAGPSDAAAARVARLGIGHVVAESRSAMLGEILLAEEEPPPEAEEEPPLETEPAVAEGGRVLAVWGPPGAPGRTTVATSLASELAARGLPVVLVDADPWGGAVAQQLGILDEVSGLLSAARLAGGGRLRDRFTAVPRRVGAHLLVVTGLPRPDRYVEVRPGSLEHLLEVAAEHGHVVVDTGASLEDDPAGEYGARPGRNAMTLATLAAAHEILVVGSADPVGLSRLARGLVDLREVAGGGPVRVVVNRMRPSIGWAERDIAGMVEGFTRISGLRFLPDDRSAVDKALVAGRSLAESGDSALARAVAALADDLLPGSRPPQRRRGPLRRRRAGTARPR